MKRSLSLKIVLIALAILIVFVCYFTSISQLNISYAENTQVGLEFDRQAFEEFLDKIEHEIIETTNINAIPRKIVFSSVSNVAPHLDTDGVYLVNIDQNFALNMKLDHYDSSLNAKVYDPTIYIYFVGDYLKFKDKDASFLFFYPSPQEQAINPRHYGEKEYSNILGYVEQIEGMLYLDITTADNTSYMFYEMKSLKSLDIYQAHDPSSTINFVDTSCMFYGCESLQYIHFPNVANFEGSVNHEGMFYGLDNLLELDLNNFYLKSLKEEMSTDYSKEETEDSLGTIFIKAKNLSRIKTPNENMYDEEYFDLYPQDLLNMNLGEFTTTHLGSDGAAVIEDINETFKDMLIVDDWQYRVGYIKYVVTVNNVDYVLGTDRYVSTMPYKSKIYSKDEINSILSESGITFEDIITRWSVNVGEDSFYGIPGEIMKYTSQDIFRKNFKSPIAYSQENPLIFRYVYTPKGGGDTPTPTPTPDPGDDPDTPSIDPIPENEGLSLGASLGIAFGVVGGTGILAGAAFFFFTAKAEIDGVTQLVIVGKKAADEVSVLTFKGKKYKIKRKNLKLRRKNKNDEVDENGQPKKKKKIKIPIFFLKR